MIHILPVDIQRLIAAGEVITRPLDVVRELIDNALDAQATRIDIELAGGGLTSISVRDNGVGISAEDLAKAPLRHATSKIQDMQDVHAIKTLGFRGEALWSIAYAGYLQITTRPQQQLGGMELFAFQDRIRVSATACPAGTKVTVMKLFEDLPARLRIQLQPSSEYRDIIMLVGRYILHHPQVGFKLTLDGELKFQHVSSDLIHAVGTVFGPLSANRMMNVQTPMVQGVISRPELTRPRRDRMHLAVNGRPIQASNELENAIISGYGEFLPAGQAPTCILNLNLPPETLDVNIHPTKTQVAFQNLSEVLETLKAVVKASLLQHPLAQAAPQPRVVTEPIQDTNALPDFRMIGVYRELYFLAESEGDLWVIDAHAAFERIWYEKLQAAFRQAEPLELTSPEMVQLGSEALGILLERAPVLVRWGFLLEPFGANLVRVRSIPQALSKLPIQNAVQLVIDSAVSGSDPERDVLARLACLPALKAGQIRMDHGQDLMNGLKNCQNPWVCPHGRPTTLRLSERDIAHAFGRRGVRDLARGRDLKEAEGRKQKVEGE
ncbi:DNA mismatch repair endonuclease MutL [Deinococcus roseus]|uniref:DNA mismatch repair protein MutL n=1 Tax=Deinococcus roseus TaxID=392414 RepID=A0ABQ2CVZ9_9DEIO|nr:DNA mismatch repair endonuclease MutL [Deinococcus roseus]GGJ21639.1 DNA mismatch repair protein MutL [Deinococcus roseus]